MKIKRIYAENYKTYRHLDLNLDVTDDERPIILIGGENGCGKTTLFDAIFHALYGLTIEKSNRGGRNKKNIPIPLTKEKFEELFNAGEKVASGIKDKMIVLEITFEGHVLNKVITYRLRHSYKLLGDRVLESVLLNMGGSDYSYGTGSTQAKQAEMKGIIDKIIRANLPKELSRYFLFDAMQASDLVSTKDLSELITDNMNMVMGLEKFKDMREEAEKYLSEKKAERQTDQDKRKAYEKLTQERSQLRDNVQEKERLYSELVGWLGEHSEEYEQLRQGMSADEMLRAQIGKLNDTISSFEKAEKDYVREGINLINDIETDVFYVRLATLISNDIEAVLASKQKASEQLGNQLTEDQVKSLTHDILTTIEEREQDWKPLDEEELVKAVMKIQSQKMEIADRYPFINGQDVKELEQLLAARRYNPFVSLNRERERLSEDVKDMPRRRQQLEDLLRQLGDKDFSFLNYYEERKRKKEELKEDIAKAKTEIERISKEIEKYDFDTPQVPDPQFDTLCRLPDFFSRVYAKLFTAKKTSIERRMKELLNVYLVVYQDMIGRVELKEKGDENVEFRMYHINGNEIYLNQLNAGAKQTVMQVLLKVLYELGDYYPPVMIDTVMGVLDKASREVILAEYFPKLADQVILLSTDTEITTEQDFKKIQKHVAHAYTLHRDKEQQCTTVTEDYFGLIPQNI